MKQLIFMLLLLFTTTISFAQSNTNISVIDFVKIKDNHRAEAMYYYEKNWKAARDIAVRKGFIKSYSLLSVTADSATDVDLVLITVYTDSIQFKLTEERFAEIFKEIRTGGPILLNDLKPAQFRQNVLNKKAETIFTSEN